LSRARACWPIPGYPPPHAGAPVTGRPLDKARGRALPSHAVGIPAGRPPPLFSTPARRESTATPAVALTEFAASFGCHVVTTLMGIGGARHQRTLRSPFRMLRHSSRRFRQATAVDDCDFLIAVGARFDDWWRRAAKFAHNARHIRTWTSIAPEVTRSSACPGATWGCSRGRCGPHRPRAQRQFQA